VITWERGRGAEEREGGADMFTVAGEREGLRGKS
jgi:hypothetical protein